MRKFYDLQQHGWNLKKLLNEIIHRYKSTVWFHLCVKFKKAKKKKPENKTN